MKTIAIALAAIVLCALPAVAFAQQTATITRRANLRRTASTAQPRIAPLAPRVRVTLLSSRKRQGYYHVQTAAGRKGWVWAKNLRIEAAGSSGGRLAPVAPLPGTPGTEAVDDPSCPPEGRTHRTGAAKEDDELRNRAKRFIAMATPPVPLSIDDFRALQVDTDPDAVDHVHRQLPRTLTGKHAGIHTVSEGDRVSVSGFLNRAEDGGASESSNCGGEDGVDIHLNIGPTAPHPKPDEWKGIVAEVIPQLLPAGWAHDERADVKAALKAVMKAKLPVLAIGSLTYDNEHQVNADKNHPRGSNPKRISLWEVHPVLEFYVCPAGVTCDPQTPQMKWETLKEWKAHAGT